MTYMFLCVISKSKVHYYPLYLRSKKKKTKKKLLFIKNKKKESTNTVRL